MKSKQIEISSREAERPLCELEGKFDRAEEWKIELNRGGWSDLDSLNFSKNVRFLDIDSN